MPQHEDLANESGIRLSGRGMKISDDGANAGKDGHVSPKVATVDQNGINLDVPTGWTPHSHPGLEDGITGVQMTYGLLEALLGLPRDVRLERVEVNDDQGVVTLQFSGAEKQGWAEFAFRRVDEQRVVVAGFDLV